MRKLGVVVIALALAACTRSGAQEKPGAKAGGPPPALPVTAIVVQPRDVPVSYEAVGRTEGSRDIQVRARVQGILEKQLYTEGDKVKAGQPLFQIERAPFAIALEQARGTLAQQRAALELAKEDAKRLKGLVDRRAISQREADQAESTLQQSRAAVQVAEAKVRQAELDLSYTTVRAPIAGVSGRALQSIGSLVSPTDSSALLTTITRNDPIWVRFALSESEYDKVRATESKAIQVKLELSDGATYPHPGKLNFASSTVDTSTGTVQMRAALPNPESRLLPGQYVRVHVIAGTQRAFVVPQLAVMQSQSGHFVWTVAGGKATPRPVEAGAWIGSDWVILGGLKPGDRVIVDNLVKLRPGVPVQAKDAG